MTTLNLCAESQKIYIVSTRIQYSVNTSLVSFLRLFGTSSIRIIGGPETRVFILVALARVIASHWFNIMTLY